VDIPRFCRENINTELLGDDLGDAFQRFVHDLLLPEYPELHLFPGAGKDGAIDLSQTRAGSRTVFQCKHIGEDGLAEAHKRWRDVAKNLKTHLADPSCPTTGQAQYGPWYDKSPAITEFIFCLSSTLANQKQYDELRQEIVEFFAGLAKEHKHLEYLSRLSVDIFDWNTLCVRLRQHPHLMFRWFPLTRPQGLMPLDESLYRGTFRSYLASEKLPYYSLAQYLKVDGPPEGIDILDEVGMLGRLQDSDITGLVITGSGGIGKTRLTIELGRLAREKGWSVLRVLSHVGDDALERLVGHITPDTPVLLLLDYIEERRDFTALVEKLNDLNDNYSLRLRYVASCRTSYYPTLAAMSRHQQINLSPTMPSSAVSWFERYRRQTLYHILEQSGLQATDKHIDACRNIPILAVFLSYLHSIGHDPDLAELLNEADFGTWVTRRVQLSFGQPIIRRDLALLMALLPMPPAIVARLDQSKYVPLFDILASDGWIEKLLPNEPQEMETWVTAHDVLADQILASYFRSIPHTLELFVNELLSVASSMGCLDSALYALQRLQPELASLDWPTILGRKMTDRPEIWREVRGLLIWTSLLTPPQIITLLSEHEKVWNKAEEEIEIQHAFGWLARWLVDQPEYASDARRREILISWIQKALPHTELSNFVITCGLRLSPEALREPARLWMHTWPRRFQTHYLIVAWLKSGLPVADVYPVIRQWAEKFQGVLHLTFVVRAWLDAGGEKELVQDHIAAWLGGHDTETEASFVYRGWLDAGGEKELVQDHIAAWLGGHDTETEASFVYSSWLNAGGEKELVQDRIAAWLGEHSTEADARFIYSSWLNAGGEKELVQDRIAAWLGEHSTEADARFIYSSWLNAGGEKQLVQDHIAAWLGEHGTEAGAKFIYSSWLDAGGEKELVQDHVVAWLGEHGTEADAKFVYRSWLDAGGEKELVQDHVVAWLGEHGTEADASFVYRGWLDAGGEKELVQDHVVAWLSEHGTEADADFVYRSWLDAGGKFSAVKAGAIQWLRLNYDKEEAVFLTKFLARQSDIPVETVNHILMWCRKFPSYEDALWRLTQLGKHLLAQEVAEDVIVASSAVLEPVISGKAPLTPVRRGQINTLFSYLIDAPHLCLGDLRSHVDNLFLAWLRNPNSFGGEPKPHANIQRISYFQRIVDLIVSGAIDTTVEQEPLERFLHWVAKWEPKQKSRLHSNLVFLKQNYPVPGLWDIVD